MKDALGEKERTSSKRELHWVRVTTLALRVDGVLLMTHDVLSQSVYIMRVYRIRGLVRIGISISTAIGDEQHHARAVEGLTCALHRDVQSQAVCPRWLLLHLGSWPSALIT